MSDVSIVNETSPEANWNGQTGRQADGQTGKPICREAAPPKSIIIVINNVSYPLRYVSKFFVASSYKALNIMPS